MRFALQNWKEMVGSHAGRACRRPTTGSPQGDQELVSVKLKLHGWLGLCHCSAQLLPGQWRSLLRVSQRSFVAWGHGRPFKPGLSRCREFAHLHEGQRPNCSKPFIIVLLTAQVAPTASNSNHKPH